MKNTITYKQIYREARKETRDITLIVRAYEADASGPPSLIHVAHYDERRDDVTERWIANSDCGATLQRWAMHIFDTEGSPRKEG